MKALVKYGAGDRQVEVRDVPEPARRRGRLVVEIAAAGVCGSDLHSWRNSQSWPLKLPLILGHEMSGRIVDNGSLSDWEPGQEVVCETAESVCGSCRYCHSGAYNLCRHRLGYGAMADGAFTRYLSVRPEIVHRIPAGVLDRHAALTEPACVAYNALVERTRIIPGDVVVVQGAGAIGIMAAQLARIAGAGHIVVLGTDLDPERLRVATRVGADEIVNITEVDPTELVHQISGGVGADLVVDCTGVSSALEQGMALVRPLGTIAKIGWGPQPLGFSLDPLVAKAATLATSFSHTWTTWERVLGLIATGALRMDPVIGGVHRLDAWEQAFEEMESGQVVKSVLTDF